MSLSRIWFITGAASGFGRRLTERVLSLKERAVAVDINPSALESLQAQYPPSQLLVQECDVTKSDNILAAFSQTKQAFGRCDVVFNNAGVLTLGEVEGTPETTARKMMDINFWGASNVSREAVRFFREDNPKDAGGMLVVTTSTAGALPGPCIGYYSASKHALEAITESMYRELNPGWNISVAMIEPGAFATAIGSAMTLLPIHPAYAHPTSISYAARDAILNYKSKSPDGSKVVGDPAKAAARIVELVNAARGQKNQWKDGLAVPLRCTMGTDAIALIKPKADIMRQELALSEQWSTDLTVD